jgi:alpha-ketoglutarate-dependent taurine dioxygenase
MSLLEPRRLFVCSCLDRFVPVAGIGEFRRDADCGEYMNSQGRALFEALAFEPNVSSGQAHCGHSVTGPEITKSLASNGVVRISNSGVASPKDFDEFVRSAGAKIEHFSEESSPRTVIEGAVSSSTDYPSRYPIQFHNEFSYASAWPRVIMFCCLQPAESGGGTPIADSRRVLKRLCPSTRATFADRGLLYERNYTTRSGVPWQQAFGTKDPEIVERYCAGAGIEYQWRVGGGLSTRQTGAAIVAHPVSRELVWFNHALLFSVQGLEPARLRASFARQPPQDRASNTYFGDGGQIPTELFDEIRAAYMAERVLYPWHRGDILILDNMLIAHGREEFTGSRQVVVAMSDRWSRDDLPEAGRHVGT